MADRMDDAPARGTVGVLGAGVMGQALLAGLLRAGWPTQDIVVTCRQESRAEVLRQQYGVQVVDNLGAARTQDTLILGVKPRDIGSLLDEIAPGVPDTTLILSVAAGISTGFIENRLKPQTPVIRVMPNTPALVGQGVSALSTGRAATAEHVRIAQDILGATGKVVQIPEYQQHAATAVSGSGPAYIFLVAEALIDAGVAAGLPRTTAKELAVQTILGAATMLAEPDTHPTLLREQVSSPGGTTIAAVRALEQDGLRAAFMGAVQAAHDRSEQLAEQ